MVTWCRRDPFTDREVDSSHSTGRHKYTVTPDTDLHQIAVTTGAVGSCVESATEILPQEFIVLQSLEHIQEHSSVSSVKFQNVSEELSQSHAQISSLLLFLKAYQLLMHNPSFSSFLKHQNRQSRNSGLGCNFQLAEREDWGLPQSTLIPIL